MRGDIVAGILDLGARERLFLAFEFLQAECVGTRLLEVGEQMAEPLTDGIDVPGRDAQGVLLCRQSAQWIQNDLKTFPSEARPRIFSPSGGAPTSIGPARP